MDSCKLSNILRLMAWLALMMLGGCGSDDPVKGCALDRSFNAPNGYAILPSIAGVGVSTGGVEAAVQPDGRIVVAGLRSGPLGDDVLVLRYTADGLLDASFGAGGIATFNGSGVGNDRALGLALQPDGKILVAGESATALSQDALILRLLPNGTLDTSFAGQGVFLFNGPVGGLDRFFDVKVQADGKVLAAGSSAGVTGVDILLVRLDPGGAPDASFGAGAVGPGRVRQQPVGAAQRPARDDRNSRKIRRI